MSILIDAHEDLAYNILSFGRDFTHSAYHTREIERDTRVPVWNNGECLLGWPEYQKGKVAVVFATLFASPMRYREGDWDILTYRDPQQARQLYQKCLDAYLRLVDRAPDMFRLITRRTDLDQILEDWARNGEDSLPNQPGAGHPVGLVLSMEGAEGVRSPAELEEWRQQGVQIIGPAWFNRNQYCGGNGEPGGLTRDGHELLETMAALGFALDISHMDPNAAEQALDCFSGPVIASHTNPAIMLKESATHRQLSNEIINRLIERGGVIGIALNNGYLKAGWTHTLRNAKSLVHLDDVAAHIDTICQMAGNTRHVGIGSDFDGGFGSAETPAEIDTIADLQKLATLLSNKGYNEEDIAALFSKNWVTILQQILPNA